MSESKPKSPILKVLHFLSKPDVFFFTAIWLIILLVYGTIDQKYNGLFMAQQKYFSSWFVWGIFPGGRLAMSIVFVNLACKLIFNSPIRFNRIGTLVTHSGMLLLLLGGFFTAYFSNEGSMPIPEGKTGNYYQDYHQLEFAVIDKSHADYDAVTVFNHEYIKEGAVISDPDLPFTISVETFHRNIDIIRREPEVTNGVFGFAQRFQFVPKKLENEFAQNMAGMVLKIEGLGEGSDGTYMVFQFMEIPQTVRVDGKEYVIELRNKRYQLPFSIELLDFKKKVHPGTQMASHYSSLVNVITDGFKREVLISMNEPLRTLNYTFYQASFIEGVADETTVLAVVQNAGRNFPYISSCIMAAGLFLHLLIQVPKLIVRSKRKVEVTPA
ncbi:MAG: cytochrome c biogenesis protein ResB [Verrucomicrobia bacterium]|nr:cytochrome c biogenesis protein ResB [Verrucomicrobiota bacterium]MDA1066365.1 cytochrome c biogenesis protein ResB [Verrucomicrobiota bacterium]